MKIDLSDLSRTEIAELFTIYSEHLTYHTASSNKLLIELAAIADAAAPEIGAKIVETLNLWSKANNDVELEAEKMVSRVAGVARDGESTHPTRQ